MSEYAFLIAHQRSGSHFLGFCIDSHPDVTYVDELTRFKSIELLRKQIKTEKNLLDFLEEKFGHIDTKIILIDVKYNHLFKPILKLMEKSKVIHLYRENKLDTYYSALHAEHRRKYKLGEYREGGEVTDRQRVREYPTLLIDNDILDYLTRSQFFFHKKYGHIPKLTFTYEQITGNKNVKKLRSNIMKRICKFLKIREHPMVAKTIKMSPSDVKPYLKGL